MLKMSTEKKPPALRQKLEHQKLKSYGGYIMKNKKIIFRRLITALLCGAMIISLGGCDINQIIGDAVSNALNSAVDEYYGSGNGNDGSSSNFQGDNDANDVRPEVSEALSAIRTVIKLSDAFCVSRLHRKSHRKRGLPRMAYRHHPPPA